MIQRAPTGQAAPAFSFSGHVPMSEIRHALTKREFHVDLAICKVRHLWAARESDDIFWDRDPRQLWAVCGRCLVPLQRLRWPVNPEGSGLLFGYCGGDLCCNGEGNTFTRFPPCILFPRPGRPYQYNDAADEVMWERAAARRIALDQIPPGDELDSASSEEVAAGSSQTTRAAAASSSTASVAASSSSTASAAAASSSTARAAAAAEFEVVD